KKIFLHLKNKQNRNKFFKKYTKTQRNDIRTSWYEYMTKIKADIMFFDYLPIYNNQQENKHIFMNKKSTTTWITIDNKVIEIIHLPSEKIQINISNGKIQATPSKLHSENTNTLVTVNETNKIIEQNNYTNKHLQIIGSQLSLIETLVHKTGTDPKTKYQTSKPLFTPYTIHETFSDNSVQDISNQLSVIKTQLLTQYCHKPTYPDLQIEERENFIQASYQSGTIYEQIIDGMNESHIINKLQKMTMVSNAYKSKTASDKVVANLLTVGFT
ncbi:hypothetical protein CFOL_v3_35011, partial [Cephalotus follicularis]